MIVSSIAGEMAEWFGHEGGPQTLLLGHRTHHPFEKSVAVSRGHGIRVEPVDFKLAIGVFVIVGIGAPTQLLHVADQGGHHVEVVVERSKIVAGLPGRIGGIPWNVLPILLLLEQHELRFHAHMEDVTLLTKAFELASQNRAGTIGPRLSVHVQVAGHPGDGFAPRQYRQGTEIGNAHHVGVLRTLVEVAGGKARESCALLLHLFRVGCGHHLGFWRPA